MNNVRKNNKSCRVKMISALEYLSGLFLAVISVSMNKITVGGNGIMIIL